MKTTTLYYIQSFTVLLVGLSMIFNKPTYFEGAVLITLGFILNCATKILEKLEQKEKDAKSIMDKYWFLREKNTK